jgi:hypothetical protein
MCKKGLVDTIKTSLLLLDYLQKSSAITICNKQRNRLNQTFITNAKLVWLGL